MHRPDRRRPAPADPSIPLSSPPSSLLSAWGWGAAGVTLFLLAWTWAAAVVGSFVLPTPLETLSAAWNLILSGRAGPAILDTGVRVVLGFVLALIIGGVLGVSAGMIPALRQMIGPLATMLLAVPPIAWIVLAVLWFGPGTPAVLFTVVVSLATVPYLAALNGIGTVDPDLAEMTNAFRLSRWQRFRHLHAPHLMLHLAPAAISSFGLSWRLTLLAEVVAATSGIGSGLAAARSNLDTAESFAWIGMVILLFLGIRGVLLQPLEQRLLPWRRGNSLPGAG